MDLKDMVKQIRHILLLLKEGGFKIPMILTSVDRYGSVMLAQYTLCLARRIIGIARSWRRNEEPLFEPPINMLFVDARGEAARVVFDAAGERRIAH